MKTSTQRGVALVITLLMLSIITVVTVAFLALSRRERANVAGSINLMDARTMADGALERAIAQVQAPILGTTNMLAGGLIVSRAYSNQRGFDPADPVKPDPYNVNFDFKSGGGALGPNDFMQNVANLLIDPRAPVFVRTNRPGAPPASEFRFYLDLNRNGRFETNGFFFPYDDAGQPVGTNVIYFVGDPEWIGVLERPGQPHSANNRFIGRYAYIILPVGKSLDLNFIHNQSQPSAVNTYQFLRDQGFGTYEINLAAFLTMLNTNLSYGWGDYVYLGTNGGSTGMAFSDARDLLRYRYQGDYNPAFDSVGAIFGSHASDFTGDGIDGLAHGASPIPEDVAILAWPGASSRQHFHSLHDFFTIRDPAHVYTNFSTRLNFISSRNNSRERYTYYRMLSQLGVESAEEPEHADVPSLIQQISAQKPEEFLADTVGRINLNYDNINHVASEFTNWDSLTFFTNVGNILLREKFPFGITNIPVAPTNYYFSSVHRLLQVAANIQDATSPDPFPSVFLPLVGLGKDPFTGLPSTNIVGYITNVTRASALSWAATNQLGLPAIVGAKKGLPNFNEFVFQTSFQITRKLELARPRTNSLPTQTNQIMLLSISNLFGAETWNSYSQPFSNSFQIHASNNFSATLVNAADGYAVPLNYPVVGDTVVLSSTNGNWYFKPRLPNRIMADNGFITPLYTNVVLLTNSRYLSKKGFDSATNSFLPRDGKLPAPDWRLVVSNRLTYVFSVLGVRPRVLDVVCFNYQTNLNLTEMLMGRNNDFTEPSALAGLWDTNRIGGSASDQTPTEGIARQLRISLGQEAMSDADWKAYNFQSNDKQSSIDSFKAFVNNTAGNSNLFQQAPFAATRRFVHTVTWQANDPLVHYMLDDLKDTTNNAVVRFVKPNDTFTNNLNLGRLNTRYRPWLGNPNLQSTDPNDTDVGVKDPGMLNSDMWDFPSQKFASIGWLGRVHRGTPWQTIYLKAKVTDPTRWAKQSLDFRTHPTNDWRLLDIFTVAQIPNASHGQLSINQSGMESWAAVLGGVDVVSNTTPQMAAHVAPSATNFTHLLVDPTQTPVMQYIVDGINRARLQKPNQVFHSLGDLMSVPELTTQSPFINTQDDVSQTYGFDDEAYERIPRQILSLLKVGDARYVVYAFGQSLKPADKSIVTTSGPFFGMCTNYQVTGEVYTRALVKIEGKASSPKPAILNFNILPVD